MTEDTTTSTSQAPAWRLLVEFSLPAGPHGARVAAERAVAAVRGLGLQATQVEQIRQAVVGAARNVAKVESQDRCHAPLCVRIWIQDGCSKKPDGSDTDVAQATRQQDAGRRRRGWGFFMVEKQDSAPKGFGTEPQRAIEFYLYEERARRQAVPPGASSF